MAAQLQALLRFLSQDAKVPLAAAMGNIKDLQVAGLLRYARMLITAVSEALINMSFELSLFSVEELSKADLATLQSIFKDSKVAKQVHNAAKRVSRRDSQKRKDGPGESDISTEKSSFLESKRMRTSSSGLRGEQHTPYEIELSLSLPQTSESEEVLCQTILKTNRAPLVLAFAVAVTKYTMPEQPLSSRLSLAQAVVSANSRSKAVSLGIESSSATAAAADEPEWGRGQPVIKLLGREISVLKRWDYDPHEGRPDKTDGVDVEEGEEKEEGEGKGKAGADKDTDKTRDSTLPPLWGLDIEAVKRQEKGRTVQTNPTPRTATSDLPIHTPESARSYLLKSFTYLPKERDSADDVAARSTSSPQKKPAQSASAEKEICLGLLLQALDILFSSWASILTAEELDRRAWSWYVRVRPEIQAGVAGWGEKGALKLADIMALKR
jgi:hypothetical protein